MWREYVQLQCEGDMFNYVLFGFPWARPSAWLASAVVSCPRCVRYCILSISLNLHFGGMKLCYNALQCSLLIYEQTQIYVSPRFLLVCPMTSFGLSFWLDCVSPWMIVPWEFSEKRATLKIWLKGNRRSSQRCHWQRRHHRPHCGFFHVPGTPPLLLLECCSSSSWTWCVCTPK